MFVLNLTTSSPLFPSFYNNGQRHNDPTCVIRPNRAGEVKIGAVSVLMARDRHAIGFHGVLQTVQPLIITA
jgi:hypothetical protein